MPLDPKKIESVMEAKGLSRADLSRLTGIAPPHITRLLLGERLNPSLETVERIATALKTPLPKLLAAARTTRPR